MPHNSRWILLTLGLLLCLTSCKIDSLGDPIVVANVKDEFLVDMYEKLSPEGRGLYFEISTIEDQECSNTEIGFKYQQSGAQIEISIQEIAPPSDCQPGNRPALTQVGTAPLLRGLYFLQIDLLEAVRNQGRLQVTDNFYQVNFDNKNGIIFRHDQIFRIPENLIWGMLRIPMARTDIFESWQEDIALHTDRAELAEGNYGHFTIKQDGSVKLRDAGDLSATTFQFVYQMADDRERIRETVEAFNAKFPNAQLQLTDSEGFTY